MEPSKNNRLKILAIVAGLIIIQACGGSKSTSSSYTPSSGDSSGVTISNDVASPAEMEVGDIMMVQFSDSDSAEFDFEDVDGASSYYMAVGAIDYDGSNHYVQMTSDLAVEIGSKSASELALEEDSWDDWSPADAFQQRLFDIGRALAVDETVEVASPGAVSGDIGMKAAAVDASIATGDTREFKVLNSFSGYSWTTVEARARCVTSNTIIYVDTEVEETNPDDLTDADVAIICDNFHDQITMEREWFGDESDVNGDGKVVALLTPQVNRLGAIGGGIITGFFMSADLFSAAGTPISNEMEIVYTLVPDSRGSYGTVIPKTFGIENLIYAVLPHELQHVISYNQHVFVGEGSSEEDWLNEGMSHLVEDLVGYGRENYSRAAIYLNSTSSYPLVSSGSPNLGERGAAYLFMRFLMEQHPDPEQFLWDLYHSNLGGVANLEAAYDGTLESFDQFGEFFMRWITALALSDKGISADPRYSYEERTLNEETGNYEGICLHCTDTGDGRGTTMSGPSMYTYYSGSSVSLSSSSVRFYEINSAPDKVEFASAIGSDFGAVLMRKE